MDWKEIHVNDILKFILHPSGETVYFDYKDKLVKTE